VKNALKVVAQKYGRLDIAVNCAGIGIAAVTYNHNKDRVHELADFMKVLSVSFHGVDTNLQRSLWCLNNLPNVMSGFIAFGTPV
jgi:3-hydroxyacyl-CoA dehydrogenase / 3-hydroxy-2-methylbutyryl-CoA dehydrogenase